MKNSAPIHLLQDFKKMIFLSFLFFFVYSDGSITPTSSSYYKKFGTWCKWLAQCSALWILTSSPTSLTMAYFSLYLLPRQLHRGWFKNIGSNQILMHYVSHIKLTAHGLEIQARYRHFKVLDKEFQTIAFPKQHSPTRLSCHSGVLLHLEFHICL